MIGHPGSCLAGRLRHRREGRYASRRQARESQYFTTILVRAVSLPRGRCDKKTSLQQVDGGPRCCLRCGQGAEGGSAMTWHHMYFSFSGRIDREHFDRASRVLLGITMLGGNLLLAPIIEILWFGPPVAWRWYSPGQQVTGFLVSAVLMTVPMSALVSKRLNDAGRSRWLVLAPCLPYLAATGVTLAIYNVRLGPTLTALPGSPPLACLDCGSRRSRSLRVCAAPRDRTVSERRRARFGFGQQSHPMSGSCESALAPLSGTQRTSSVSWHAP